MSHVAAVRPDTFCLSTGNRRIGWIESCARLVFIISLLATYSTLPARSGDRVDSLKVGILPDTQGSGDTVAIHPLKAVLDKLYEHDVDIVIPIGDITNGGTADELSSWSDVARSYATEGIEFLPLMGNHETAWGSKTDWIEYMKDFIPRDATHMSGFEYRTYYVLRDNVLIILVEYGHLSSAFEWMKQAIETNRPMAEHIIIASHDGLVGSKYGQTKSMLSSRGTGRLYNQWDEIRSYFSKHDIIWVQGHEHIYQRSVISSPSWISPSSWTISEGNYRLPQYTQIISGNASYKGYDFRYGEREKIQSIIKMRINTGKNGSTGYDANASLFSFIGSKVDYISYVTSHTIDNNEDGPGELSDPEWIVLDQFTRTNNRCDKIVYPNSIPPDTRTSMVLDPSFRTNNCYAHDGSIAKIIDGKNETFDRFDSTGETIGWDEGFSRGRNIRDLARLLYQHMFQYHQPWSPNLNGNQRLMINEDESLISIPETTIDVKKHLTLSWLPKTDDTISDILVINGTQTHTGIYTNSDGMRKDIEADVGLPGSQPDGNAKSPVVLQGYATKQWDLTDSQSDNYVLEFSAPDDIDTRNAALAFFNGQSWQAFTDSECIIEQSYEEGLIENSSESFRGLNCDEKPLVGYDKSQGNRWWVSLNTDVEVALIED